MTSFVKTVRKEIISAIPAIIYFAIAFNLINYTEKLILRPYDFDYVSWIKATIGALLVGKFLILVNALPFINLFPKRPLIYNTVWKVTLYTVASVFFRCFDLFMDGLAHFRHAELAWLHVQTSVTRPEFWAIQLWLLMLFAVYVVFSELSETLGAGKIRQLFFSSPRGKI